MSNKLKSKRKQQESMATAMKQFLAYLLDGMVCVYMLLIIVVMPFYHEQGFAYIGTNKAMFFRNVSVNGAWFIIPTVILYLIFAGVEKAKERKKAENQMTVDNAAKQKLSIKDRCRNIRKACRKHLSVTDMFALLYGVSLLLSYICSEYRDVTWDGTVLWGSDGWHMGFLPQMFLLGIYFMVSRLWKKRNWMYLLFLPVSAVVFVLGYLNRFGFYPIDMGMENASFLSTIGNINWYCGYLVSVFFGGYYLLWQRGWVCESMMEAGKKMPAGKKTTALQWLKKILLVAYVAVGFASLVTQGSLSGLVALAVILIVAFCMSAGDSSKMLGFWQGTLILSLVCVVTWGLRNVFGWVITFGDPFVELLTNSSFPMIAAVTSLAFVIGIGVCNRYGKYPVHIFRCAKWLVGGGALLMLCLAIGLIVVNTLNPGSIGALSDNSFFTFNPEWGSNRGATWKAGWMCFTEQNLLHKIIGVGPDAMEAYISRGASEELTALVTERFGTNRLTNAHCEWLTILVNTGLMGFAGFVGMVVSAMMRLIRCGSGGSCGDKQSGISSMIAGACGFCLLAYTVNNMFSFQQSMSVVTIFIILGIGEACARAHASSFLSYYGKIG